MFPHRAADTAALQTVQVPCNRTALFLAIENERLHDKRLDELSFSAFSPAERATFQFLLYLTYCCKGQLFQVTLENPDFYSMSPPIREDFAHGRMFCFVLDMDNGDSGEDSQPSSSAFEDRLQGDSVSGSQITRLMTVDLEVFNRGNDEQNDYRYGAITAEVKYIFKEAYDAFMRLQLVRKKISSLNMAMIAMRDTKGELSPMFEWVDICSDTLNASKVDKKKVKEVQGSMFTPVGPTGRPAVVLPETIVNLNLKDLDDSIGKLTDRMSSYDVGKHLLESALWNLTETRWCRHAVLETRYNPEVEEDSRFVRSLKGFTRNLYSSRGETKIGTRGLLVFRYSLGKLITVEAPDLFVKSLIHRHMPVPKCRIDQVLYDLKRKSRTGEIKVKLNSGICHCAVRGNRDEDRACKGDCQTAYACFYNYSENHPFAVSKDKQSHYFAQLYPHLAKLERLSEEMKLKDRGRRQFESIADMVFNHLVRQQFCDNPLYEGLSEVVGMRMQNSSFSLGCGLSGIHQMLCLAPHRWEDYPEQGEGEDLNPLKVYDHELVRYLFCDSLQVGRLFQASTTFNYIIANTAPRYTIERIMLFNITGPGEGKSYANNVLNYQFRRVRGCIETLTSFTRQAFKYTSKRSSCVVMIDDPHLTHEKNVKAADKDSNVIPNMFKKLLDSSILESEVVTTDPKNGNMANVKYNAVHNCGFVWNTNTLDFVSEAWADRSFILESEFQKTVSRTRSTKQVQDTVERYEMDRIAAVCLYRQNLIQSATMIAESSIMQFSENFDKARDACVSALYASHIVCTRGASRRHASHLNQLVFAEALKLACHFVFDLWIPPWTEIPNENRYPDLLSYMTQMNKNRLKALNKLSFGQLCLDTNAVFKLCTAACLPDICPRTLDVQGRVACDVLGYILRQVHEQHLKSSLKDGHLCILGIDKMFFSEGEIQGGSEAAHDMLFLCPWCRVPARETKNTKSKTYQLCSCRHAANQNTCRERRSNSNPRKKVGSVTIPLEVVYDLLALRAPSTHEGFWHQLLTAMLGAYENRDYDLENPFDLEAEGEERMNSRRLIFDLDFTADPLRSMLLEATVAIEPLNELEFNRSALGSETFRCSAPLYYGGVLVKALGARAPQGAYHDAHLREATIGPRDTFHGPRLSVYASEYSGVPVKNMSSFCTTRTVYHQDKVLLRADRGERSHTVELLKDWEWKDAADVFNTVHGPGVFSEEMLKRDYAATMMVVKGDSMNAPSKDSVKLNAIRALRAADGNTSLKLRRGESSPDVVQQPSNSQTRKATSELISTQVRSKKSKCEPTKQRPCTTQGKKARH